MERDLTLNLSVKKKTNELGSMTKDAKNLSTEFEKSTASSKKLSTEVERLEKNIGNVKSGMLDLGKATLLLGSAGGGIQQLITNLMKLGGAIYALRGARDVLASLKDTIAGLNSMRSASSLLNAARENNVSPSRLLGNNLLSMARGTGISPKALSSGFSTAAKYAGVAGVGAGALGAAGAIVSGVNAADNFLVSRGGKPYLGDGSWDRDASGRLHDWSPTRLANRAEIATIGGGKINAKGDIVSNDELMNRAIRRNKLQQERVGNETTMAEMHRAQSMFGSEVGRQSLSASSTEQFYNQIPHYRNVVSKRMSGEGTGDYKNILSGKANDFELIFGREAAGEKMRGLQESILESGRGVGERIGTATAAEKRQGLQIDAQRSLVNSIQSREIGMLGGKKNEAEELSRMKELVAEQQKLAQMEQENVGIIKERQSARQQELLTMKDQAKTMEDMYRAEAQSARNSLRGMKQQIGSMAPWEAKQTMALIEKANKDGLGALTPEARSKVAPFLKEESNRFAEGQADKLGFDSVMKGTFAERKIGVAEANAEEAKKQRINLQTTYEIVGKVNSDEVAKKTSEILKPLYSEIVINQKKISDQQEEQWKNQQHANMQTEHNTSK